MKKEKTYQKIEDYLQGKLSESDIILFEKELEENKDLRVEFNLHKSIHEDMSSDVMSLKQKLDEIKVLDSDNSKRSNPRILSFIIRYGSIAAVLILAVVFLPNILKSDLSPDVIYNNNYEVYAMALNQRSNTSIENNNVLNRAIQNYLDKDYSQASENFKIVYAMEADDLYLLYAGNSFQAEGDYNSAIEIFDGIIENGNPQIIQQAQWYKALCLIKLNDTKSASKFLESLGEDHYQEDKIRRILKNLNKLNS